MIEYADHWSSVDQRTLHVYWVLFTAMVFADVLDCVTIALILVIPLCSSARTLVLTVDYIRLTDRSVLTMRK